MKNTTIQSNYLFSIGKLPKTNFSITSTTIPTVVMGETIQPSRTHNIAIPGSHIEYDPLTIEFLIDEDFANYIEILKWIQSVPKLSLTDATSDATLQILSNNKQPLVTFHFNDVFPTILTEVQFSTQTTSEPQVCTLTLKYTSFYVA